MKDITNSVWDLIKQRLGPSEKIQMKKEGSELDKKRRNLGKKRSNLDKNKQSRVPTILGAISSRLEQD